MLQWEFAYSPTLQRKFRFNRLEDKIYYNKYIKEVHFNDKGKPKITRGFLLAILEAAEAHSFYREFEPEFWGAFFKHSLTVLSKSDNSTIKKFANKLRKEKKKNNLQIHTFEDVNKSVRFVNPITEAEKIDFNMLGFRVFTDMLRFERNKIEISTELNQLALETEGHNSLIIWRGANTFKLFRRPCWGTLFSYVGLSYHQHCRAFINLESLINSSEFKEETISTVISLLDNPDSIISKILKRVDGFNPEHVVELNLKEYNPIFIKTWIMALRNMMRRFEVYKRLLEKTNNIDLSLMLCGYLVDNSFSTTRDIVPFESYKITLREIKAICSQHRKYLKACKDKESCMQALLEFTGTSTLINTEFKDL